MPSDNNLCNVHHPEGHAVFVGFLHGTSNLDNVAPKDILRYARGSTLKTTILKRGAFGLDVRIVESERIRMVSVNRDEG